MRNRRGEIATILMLGTLVVIGVTAVISSLGLNKKTSTNTRASGVYGTCDYSYLECQDKEDTGGCENSSCSKCSGVDAGYYKCKEVAAPPAPTCTGIEVKCSSTNTQYTVGSYYKASTTAYSMYSDKCLKNSIPSVETYCKNLNPCTPRNCSSGDKKPYWSRNGKYYIDECKTSVDLSTHCATTASTPTCAGTDGFLTWGTNGAEKDVCVDGICKPNTYANKQGTSGGQRYCCCKASTAPVVSVAPVVGTCTSGQYFLGTGGYDMETPEQICSVHNGVYVRNNQQGKEVDGAGASQRWACCSVSNSSPNATCPEPGLGYACCVVDSRCDNDTNRYRWYGCTGQVCSATIITTKGGPGHLVDCPYGVNKQNQESCEGALTKPELPSADCKDYGSYGLLGGCKEKCTATGSECKASVDDASGEKRFCCPPAVPEPSPETGCTAVSITGCNEVRRENPEKTFTYADGQCCPSGTIPPDDGSEVVGCDSLVKTKCKGSDIELNYYKSKVTANCPANSTNNKCYGKSSTSCHDFGWDALYVSVCGGGEIPPEAPNPVDPLIIPPEAGTIQTNAPSDLVASAARLNGSIGGNVADFQAIGFIYDGKRYAVQVAESFSYVLTGLKPETSYTYNTYGSTNGKEVMGNVVTFKTTKENNTAANRCKANLSAGTTGAAYGTDALFDYPSAFSRSCFASFLMTTWTGTRSFNVTGKDTAGNCLVKCTSEGDANGTYNGDCGSYKTCLGEQTFGPKLNFTVSTSVSQNCFQKGFKLTGIGVKGNNVPDSAGKHLENISQNVSDDFEVIPKEIKESYTFHAWLNYTDDKGILHNVNSENMVLNGVAPQPVALETILNCK